MKTVRRKKTTRKYSGAVLIISMIFVMIFSALAVSFAAFSGANVQLAENHHKVNSALSAAESGLECGKYLVATVALQSTGTNLVTSAEADSSWLLLCDHIQNTQLDGQPVPSASRFTDGMFGIHH